MTRRTLLSLVLSLVVLASCGGSQSPVLPTSSDSINDSTLVVVDDIVIGESVHLYKVQDTEFINYYCYILVPGTLAANKSVAISCQ
jgi:hypothetical protein